MGLDRERRAAGGWVCSPRAFLLRGGVAIGEEHDLGDEHRRAGRPGSPDEEALKRLKGHEAREREAAIPSTRSDAEIERSLEIGLTVAESVGDRTISTFVRTELPHSAGMSTFMGFSYVEDVREVGNYEVATRAPLDIGTSFRPCPRFGLQSIRRASAHYGPYNYKMGINIREQLRVADVGDVFVLLTNIEKSFDQVARGQPSGRERSFPGDPGRARHSGRTRDAGRRRAPRRVRPSLTRSFPALLPCVSPCGVW